MIEVAAPIILVNKVGTKLWRREANPRHVAKEIRINYAGESALAHPLVSA